MIIYLLQDKEIPQIAEIECECFSHPWSEKSLRDSFRNPNVRFFAAREDGKIIGYVSTELILDEGYIMNVAVKPDFRRRGVGRALVEYLINYSEKELKFLTLEVRVSNAAAIALYEKLGFEKVGTRRNYYRNPTEDALLLTLNSKKEK